MIESHIFDPTVLREYDIRGIVGQTLHEVDAYAMGRSFGSLIRRDGGQKVAIGYDGRLSSPMLAEAVIAGLNQSGIDVVNIGMGPTPMLYYAQASIEDVSGGIQITGSHNPPDHNGFKMVFRGRPFFGADIQKIGAMAEAGEWSHGAGTREGRDILDAYVARLLVGLRDVPTWDLQNLRIGWDCGNGAAGPTVERLTSQMPGDHHLLFTEVDGHFPNHHPDPTEEKNLADLKALVAAKNLDFGVAFDGDADRIGVIDAKGRVIWGDQLLMIFAADLLKIVPGATIIGDVKASSALFDLISAKGGQPLMWKAGHSPIKAKMQETGVLLAGETSGHVFFKHNYYGFDDGIYAAVQLIAASSRLGKSITQLRGQMPQMLNTPELRFQVDESRKFAAIAEVKARLAQSGLKVNGVDGVRVDTSDGWWLLRASNTQDVLVARAESDTHAGLDRLLAEIDGQLALSGLRRGQQVGH